VLCDGTETLKTGVLKAKPPSNATLSITSPIRSALGLNLGLQSETLAANCLSSKLYGITAEGSHLHSDHHKNLKSHILTAVKSSWVISSTKLELKTDTAETYPVSINTLNNLSKKISETMFWTHLWCRWSLRMILVHSFIEKRSNSPQHFLFTFILHILCKRT
jgi:hypothetical protein